MIKKVSGEVERHSLIKKYISPELYLDLFKVTEMYKLSTNERRKIVKDLLDQYKVPYANLGAGTNRMGFLIDGYAFKIALDQDGMIDNRRELKYSKELYPYVVKVYECMENGLIAVFEYVSIFTTQEYFENQDNMRKILGDLSQNYLIGDVGVTSKNYVNWGTRMDGSICILDFAYCYDISYGLFSCACDGNTMMEYDRDFVGLVCPRCGKRATFWDIRKKITRKQQEIEIGNILELGYNISEPVQKVTLNPKFEPTPKKVGKKKSKDELAQDRAIAARKARKAAEENNNQFDY